MAFYFLLHSRRGNNEQISFLNNRLGENYADRNTKSNVPFSVSNTFKENHYWSKEIVRIFT